MHQLIGTTPAVQEKSAAEKSWKAFRTSPSILRGALQTARKHYSDLRDQGRPHSEAALAASYRGTNRSGIRKDEQQKLFNTLQGILNADNKKTAQILAATRGSYDD